MADHEHSHAQSRHNDGHYGGGHHDDGHHDDGHHDDGHHDGHDDGFGDRRHHDRHDEHGHHDSHDNDGHHHGWWERLRHRITPHSHDSADKVDSALESSREGLRALWISLVALGVTAALQAVVVVLSGSVALLGDTLHNVADALTAVPLGIAFLLGRRAATRAYTYGFGRAEDLAGIVIVLVIAASAIAAGWTAVHRLVHPQTMTHLPWVLAAGVIGFLGNELVARYRIGVGRRIGSAALVADGLHARTDGFTSLAVVLAAAGAWLGWRWADPAVGLVITAAIAFVLKDAAREVYRRLMDRVDPELVDKAEQSLRAVPGIRDVSGLRLRWIGHRMHAEAAVVVDADLSLLAAHEIAADAEHQLTHQVPRLTGATVHVDPASHPGDSHHTDLSHHRRDRLAAPARN
ncbi:cation diffusion facilitator family transporter [Actinoplanes auranticolor]|uniref:Cation efflux system protein n=1 Tax=Actinoplanes auranticolor TaxID=47988 RepID=A0A919VUK0_9ACTN|nr:cation diffusion facilitator family transporter [Actinoplanes auranticolor]GIM79494.1 cation efflux system protein [Actinoplanes auranticolor]